MGICTMLSPVRYTAKPSSFTSFSPLKLHSCFAFNKKSSFFRVPLSIKQHPYLCMSSSAGSQHVSHISSSQVLSRLETFLGFFLAKRNALFWPCGGFSPSSTYWALDKIVFLVVNCEVCVNFAPRVFDWHRAKFFFKKKNCKFQKVSISLKIAW